MSDDIEKDLRITAGDIVHTIAKVGIGSVPIVGTAASEIFNMVLTAPVEKRKEEWLVRIYNTLQELQEKVEGFQIEELSDNEQFISIMTRASQLAIMNHQEEKLTALHNAIINTALDISIDENEQMMFLNLVDIFTPWHLKLIYYFENPDLRFIEKGIQKPNVIYGGLIDGLEAYYVELNRKEDFVKIIFKELYNNGITNTSEIGGMMSASHNGIYASRLTSYGSRFLSYIRLTE
jgi:hypothetical protein